MYAMDFLRHVGSLIVNELWNRSIWDTGQNSGKPWRRDIGLDETTMWKSGAMLIYLFLFLRTFIGRLKVDRNFKKSLSNI